MPITSYPTVEVFQHGTSQRHTARCKNCGWEQSAGALKAAQNMAAEHRQAGCAGSYKAELVPAEPARVEPATPWTGEQIEILKRDLGIKNDGDLKYFGQVASHKGLDPFLGEITAVYYGGQMVIQDTVEGLRTIAERSGLYGGYRGPWWCGPDLEWKKVWLADTPPAAARYEVIRKDWSEPAEGVARWKSSVQLDRNGKPMPIWRDRPDEMLGKTAEVRALKRAFTKEFARVGITGRDLSDAQIVTVEAARAGLDDDARHALAAEISGGRTESTRDLTDDELLEMRAEIAHQRPGVAGSGESDPGGPGTNPPAARPAPATPDTDAVARAIARGGGNLEARLELLTPWQVDELKAWRRAQGLARPVGTLDAAERARLTVELDQRGWGSPHDLEPEADDAEVVPGDVAEPELYGDEPF